MTVLGQLLSFATVAYGRVSRQLRAPAARGQPIQLHRASPITRSRSRPFSHGSSSVNKVTQRRHEQGILVMSAPHTIHPAPNPSQHRSRPPSPPPHPYPPSP